MKKYLFVLVLVVPGCNNEETIPASDGYAFNKPSNFPEVAYTIGNNPVTKEGFELGRALFYDPILSLDSSVACANCHQQARSFTDPVHRLSKGVNEARGFRNAPPIQNAAFMKTFFWDGGVNHLDFVPINAITSELEMHEDLAHVIEKIRSSDRYKAKFATAFGTADVDSQKMLHVLSQFMIMMVSANSRYDRFIRHEGEQLTSEEMEGLTLFQSKCISCHATELFTDGSFRNNGLDSLFSKDAGRQRITEDPTDAGKFKVPSLRNAELTFPYMHDGRFKTLEQVLDHYAANVQDSDTLDPLLKQNSRIGIPITDAEKAKIIAFIKNLTDKNFITDKRFSIPL